MRICVDSGFFFSLYDPRDEKERQVEAQRFFREYFDLRRSNNYLVLVWPVLYESLNTRFVKNNRVMESFRRDLYSLVKANRLMFLNDVKYRLEAYNTLTTSDDLRPLSLVDRVLRLMLQDKTIQIGAIFTFNQSDFSDVCKQKNIQLLPQ